MIPWCVFEAALWRGLKCTAALRLFVILLLLAGIPMVAAADARPDNAPMSAADLLGGGRGGDAAEGFARALAPRPFRFPQDHGPHPDYQTEWWYYTGNLRAVGGPDPGREFGFQLTFFRFALQPPVPRGAPDGAMSSRWRTRQLYMAHFGLTDIADEAFFSAEKFNRGALGLAGAKVAPFAVWLDDWRADGTGSDSGMYPLRLSAETDGAALALTLKREKPLVFHGDRGLSHKSAEPGNASYYYSATRLAARGEVRIGQIRYEVAGKAWMDREWSTSALAADQVGWDWFSVQLDDGTDLMYANIRQRGGAPDPASHGTIVDAEGRSRGVVRSDVALEAVEFWTSPHSGARYPIGWSLKIPSARLVLAIRAKLEDQEMRHSVRYWEGAVRIRGSRAGRPVAGDGYLELAGY